MPCEYESPQESISRLVRQANDLTRWLCATCEMLATSVGLPSEPGLREWWLDHQEQDRQRHQREAEAEYRKAQRVAALAKLTSEELAALGIRP
jgi:hypothetical protein